MQRQETVACSNRPLLHLNEAAEGDAGCILSVVIPAFNEAQRIHATMERILAYLDGVEGESEIIVVIDGGSDETQDIVEGIEPRRTGIRLLVNDRNRGKGYSVRRGMLDARGRFVLFSDADLSTPIEEATRLLATLEAGYAVTIGSRALRDSDVRVAQSWWRQSMGRVFNHVVRGLGLSRFRDTQCGFKMFTRAAARDIFSRAHLDGFAFDVEVLCIALDQGYQICELPVQWVNSPESRVRPVRDSLRMFRDLLRIRARLLWQRWFARRSPGRARAKTLEPLAGVTLEGRYRLRHKWGRWAGGGGK